MWAGCCGKVLCCNKRCEDVYVLRDEFELRIYMNADANGKLCWLCCCCCCILHSWHTCDDGGSNPIVWIGVLLIMLCSQVEGWWPSVHPWWWKWYHIHCSYEVAFHSNWHCMCMMWIVEWCNVIFMIYYWWIVAVLFYVLEFISFIMDCIYSPFCWYFPYHGKWAGTQE